IRTRTVFGRRCLVAAPRRARRRRSALRTSTRRASAGALARARRRTRRRRSTAARRRVVAALVVLIPSLGLGCIPGLHLALGALGTSGVLLRGGGTGPQGQERGDGEAGQAKTS